MKFEESLINEIKLNIAKFNGCAYASYGQRYLDEVQRLFTDLGRIAFYSQKDKKDGKENT